MAIALRGSYDNKTGTAAQTSISVTTSGTVLGDTLIALLAKDGTGATTGQPGGWTLEARVTNGTVHEVWSKEALAADVGGDTYTWTGPSEKYLLSIMVISGADHSTISTPATNSGSSSTPTCSSVTPASADSMVIASFGKNDGGTITLDSALTSVYASSTSGGQGQAGLGVGYEIHAASATGTYVASTDNDSWAASTLYIEEIDTSITVLTPGVYTYTGTDVDALKTKLVSPTLGTYTYSGTDITTSKGYLSSLTPGVYTYTGIDVEALKTKLVVPTPGVYTYTGSDITATKGRIAVLDPGVYTYTGTDVTITSSKTHLEPGVYTHTGSDVTIFKKGQPSVYINLPDSYLGYNVEV